MKLLVGIDIGGSTTKIIGLKKDKLITPMRVKATDPVTSIFGAFGKFLSSNDIMLQDIEKIMITGVGSTYIDRPIYGIPTGRVDEFQANGLGGLYITGLEAALIVSMGTGTSLVKADKNGIEHIGGTGVGGGTIIGLADRMLNIRNIEHIIQKAATGNLKNIDLMVCDLTNIMLPSLPPDTTASNFGKISDIAEQGDVALGIINLVFQTIGMNAVFAVRNSGLKDIILIGNLSTIKLSHHIFDVLGQIFKVKFVIPENSEYATAVGAALAFNDKSKYHDL